MKKLFVVLLLCSSLVINGMEEKEKREKRLIKILKLELCFACCAAASCGAALGGAAVDAGCCLANGDLCCTGFYGCCFFSSNAVAICNVAPKMQLNISSDAPLQQAMPSEQQVMTI